MPGGAVVRPPHPHELDALATVVEEAFLFRFAPAERERFLAALEPERALVCTEGELVVGTLLSYLTELTVPGPALVPVVALTDIAVSPARRGRGHLGSLLGGFLAAAHERGEQLALLEASDGGLYGRYGFGPAIWSACYRLAAHTAARLGGADAELEVLAPALARPALEAVFEAHRRHTVGEVPRGAAAWAELLEVDPSPDRARFVAVHAPGGAIDSYAIYDARPAAGQMAVELIELVAGSAAGRRGLWGLLAGLARGGLESAPQPIDPAASWLFEDPRALGQVEVRDRSWLRLVDVAGALGARRYVTAGGLCLGVRDAQCPWNEQVLRLEVDAAGAASVEVSGAPPELVLDAGALGSAYLGAVGFAALAAAGRLEERAEGAAARADGLFRAEGPPQQRAAL